MRRFKPYAPTPMGQHIPLTAQMDRQNDMRCVKLGQVIECMLYCLLHFDSLVKCKVYAKSIPVVFVGHFVSPMPLQHLTIDAWIRPEAAGGFRARCRRRSSAACLNPMATRAGRKTYRPFFLVQKAALAHGFMGLEQWNFARVDTCRMVFGNKNTHTNIII